MPLQAYDTFSQLELTPAFYPLSVKRMPFAVAAGQQIARGAVVAQVTAASATDVQTLTGTASSGTFTIQVSAGGVSFVTAVLPALATAAQIQAALQALPNIGAGGITCSGGPLATGTVVCAFAGSNVNQPQTLMVINGGALVGGSVTIAHTTTGVANGAVVNYNNAVNAAPAAAPTLSAAGSDGTLAVGAYSVAYTLVTGAGESTPSPQGTIAVASTNHIGIASITGLDASVTAVNFYVNGLFAKQVVVVSNATGAVTIIAPAASSAVAPPTVNGAYKAVDGSQIPIGLAFLPMATDPAGRITFGATASGNAFGANRYAENVIIGGYFNTADLSGLDANAVAKLGRLVTGTTTSGVLVLSGV